MFQKDRFSFSIKDSNVVTTCALQKIVENLNSQPKIFANKKKLTTFLCD